MKTREWVFSDRTGWPPGEWDDEPDKVQWEDQGTGLPCLIVRNDLGALCGYVGVFSGHPCFEKVPSDCTLQSIQVHNDITFTGKCQEDEDGICHVVEDGEDQEIWWIGFDCALGDYAPGMYFTTARVYRNIHYVKRQCEFLAKQLAGIVKLSGLIS